MRSPSKKMWRPSSSELRYSAPVIISGVLPRAYPRVSLASRGGSWNPRRAARRLLLGFLIGRQHLAGLVLVRPQDLDRVHAAELLDVVALDAVVLHQDHPALVPFAVRAELDVA